MSRWFGDALANAVDDVRTKLVEEAWFGRAVTDAEPALPVQKSADTLGWFGPERLTTDPPDKTARERGDPLARTGEDGPEHERGRDIA